MRPTYPFSAIVGQEEMKLALRLAAVDPTIGGVLILGDRGTAKSTAVRGLSALLPAMRVVDGCRYGCDPTANGARCDDCHAREARGERLRTRAAGVPVVDLPLGATEDRVAGALDIERAITRGEKTFEPGLLARAHRGFLYVDEINLLEDHLVDLLLDVATTGENLVEREGLSVRHPARFVLVGTGNPEEGELRPQLLDRFGLCVEARTPVAVAERVEVVRRRDAFDRDADGFTTRWRRADAATRREIARARAALDAVDVPDAVLERAATLCIALGVDGLRGELTLLRAARALAALEGLATVTLVELRRVAPLVLRHRLRRGPLDEVGSGVRVERAMAEALGTADVG
ncbi:MAG: magnesium chelatase ATPase subunit I [Gemmatirosa sp.]|nr:magnesium chelatase ATPase subunit I [Gemmatirosa sp.]